MTESVRAKEDQLEARLDGLGSVLVAYSGGVDSAFLLAKAVDVLGDRAEALTARSPSLPAAELQAAIALARQLGARHRVVDTREMDRPGYRANGVDRCYHCKAELFDASRLVAGDGRVVVDGFNADDLRDHRPGHRAAAEQQVVHPLAEAGLTKAEIRELSRLRGLPTWNKPQLACLASRVPYGTEVTPERLSRVEQVEVVLRGLGFTDLRARLVSGDDGAVRIELGESEIARAVQPGVRNQIVQAGRRAGFRFVTLDLEGFRSGRMNEGVVTPKLVQLNAPTKP